MSGYNFVMLAVDSGCYPHMRTALPSGLISEAPERAL